MKNKFINFIFYFFIFVILSYSFLNLITIFIYSIKIIQNKTSVLNVIKENLNWTIITSIIFGLIISVLNFIRLKYWSKNNKSKINNEKPFLIDQRNKISSYKDFEKVVSKNSNKPGIVIHWNRKRNKFNWFTLAEKHVRVLGTTGSAKSQFFILANLFRNFNDDNLSIKNKPNMLIIDPKGELFENSLKMNQIKNNYDLVRLDFSNPKKTKSWNPLAPIWDLYITKNEEKQNNAIEKIQDFLKSIPALDETSSSSPNWPLGARALLDGILKFMLEYQNIDSRFTKNHFNLINLYKLTANLDNFNKIISHYINNFEDKDGNKLYPKLVEIRNDISYILDADDGPRTSYQGTASSAISQFVSNKNIWNMLYKNDFNFLEMFNRNEKPIAFFITYPDDKPTIHPLVSLVISQAYQSALEIARNNLQIKNKEELDRNLQFFIDEFGILPKLPNFDNWINIARSRKITFVCAYQSEDQLNISYKKVKKVIEDGFSASLLLATNNIATASNYSKIIGSYQVEKESKSISSKKEESKNISFQKEEIISAGEITKLKADKYILTLNNEKPSILTKKLVYKEMKKYLQEEQQKIKRRRIDDIDSTNTFDESKIVFDFKSKVDKEMKEIKELMNSIQDENMKVSEKRQIAKQKWITIQIGNSKKGGDV